MSGDIRRSFVRRKRPAATQKETKVEPERGTSQELYSEDLATEKEKAEKERARAVREKARGSEKEERTTVTEWTLVTSATEIGRKKAGREIGVPAESNGCHLEQLGRLKDNGAARNGPRV